MLGKAELGDKIMVDTLSPAVDSLKQFIDDILSTGQAIRLSAEAAQQEMVDTIPWVVRNGRDSYLGERSPRHQDPGATSSYPILQAAADTWADS
jgi:dihydroxyacetone kinase-like protein